jgi:NADPH-dependent glutamate synthase beta subunit-like oxidoreductase
MAESTHYVAIIGGAVSGSEAAFQLAERGIRVVVFDQNPLPYGKIEDGLPKWHYRLRDKEEHRINEKLSHPLVKFVPLVQLGQELDFTELAETWGFSAILLANGAWKDRPLPIEGIDAYLGKGLVYQNEWMNWYNHYHEPNYAGPTYEAPDGTLVIGGGLASLDVSKALMFYNVQHRLAARGITVDLFSLDRSIAKVLADHKLSLADLDLRGPTLVYRRNIEDMPLTPMPTDTPEQKERARKVRLKAFAHYQSRYLFNFQPQRVPVGTISQAGRLTGLLMQHTRIVDGRVQLILNSEEEVFAPQVISSIGSLPMPIPGLPMQGSIYDVDQEDCCRVKGFSNVFALGNAVTGRGNIVESLRHGREISQLLGERLVVDQEQQFQDHLRGKEAGAILHTDHLLERMGEPLTTESIASINARIQQVQQKVGYGGDFASWITQHLPLRLEVIEGVVS